jgi:hypothetical protein
VGAFTKLLFRADLPKEPILKAQDAKKRPQDSFCDFVNQECNMKGSTPMPMQIQPLFPPSYLWPSKDFNSENYADIKPWVQKAIAEEEQRLNERLWRGERSAESRLNERLSLIRFFRKYQKSGPLFKCIADRLELCDRDNRCCSGACPECGRLLQRSFVRKSKRLICEAIDKDGHSLVAISIIPAKAIIRPGNLHTLDIGNLRRRLGYALAKAGIEVAIGAIDFSFNEDKDGKYEQFWCVHYYVITSVANKSRVRKLLKPLFASDRRIPRPVKISAFDNSSRRRSYAFKIHFKRRIGVDAIKKEKDGTVRKCRNTSGQRLRAAERLELFMYMDQIGFAERFIFRGVKPVIKSTQVKFRATDA